MMVPYSTACISGIFFCFITWGKEMGYLTVIPVLFFCWFHFKVQHLRHLVRLLVCFLVQLDLVLAIGNISLLHYCQFGTENHSLLQKINTPLATVTSSCCSWGVSRCRTQRGLARMCTWMLVSVPVAFWLRRLKGRQLIPCSGRAPK